MSSHSLDTPPRVLLIDDDPAVCDAISATLQQTLHDHSRPIASHVTTAHSLPEALALIDQQAAQKSNSIESYLQPDTPETLPWDIVIADLHLGAHSDPTNPDSGPSTGLDLLREIRGRGIPIGLILLTGRATSEDFISAIRNGVDDMLLKPVSHATIRESVARCYSRLEDSRTQVSNLRRIAEDLVEMRGRLADTGQHSSRVENTVVEALLEALEVREPGSYMHSLRVQAYTVYFAHAIGYPESLLPQLERAAILHDLGKIGLADMLLFKPDNMSVSEHERTHMHAQLGEQILSRIPFLRSAALIVRHHHEQFDGSGYPDGLRGEAIPLGARIFSMMDALDSMTNDRPYRPSLSFAAACAEIQTCAGTQFDPRLCEQLARIPISTWIDLRLKVQQRRLTKAMVQPGAVPQLTARSL